MAPRASRIAALARGRLLRQKERYGMDGSPLALCFGEVLWDILPEGRFAGGAPFNVGYHLSRLGWRVMPVSAVGDDALGIELIGLLRGWGVSTEGISVREGTATGTVAVELDGEGKPRFEIRRDVAWDEVPISGAVLGAVRAADAIVFGSLALRSLANRRALDALLEGAGGVRRVFDVNLRPPHDDLALVGGLFSRSDIIKLNDDEADRLTGCGQGEGAAERGAREIGRRAGGKPVCVTCGARGAGLLWDGEWLWECTRPVNVIDTVGSGDAFLAALVAGLHSGWPPADALRAACRLGEWVAARRGATPAYRAVPLQSGGWDLSEAAAC